MTVAHPKASCEGCAAEENKGTKYKRSGREKLCEALPSCYNCIWEEV